MTVPRRVPLARRQLLQDRRRAVLAVAGVAAALVLVLVLNGVFAGATRQVTAYIDTSPADVFVAQAGVRTMHMSITALPDDTVARVRSVDGVAWAEPLRYTTGVVTKGDRSIITYVFGYDTQAGVAGPRELSSGSAPGAGEAVVDESAASELAIGVGDTVEILGTPLRVSGLSVNGTNIVNTTVFLDTEQFTALRGPGTNYVLAGARAGVGADELASRIAAAVPDATVQTRAAFSDQESRIVRDMATDIMSIMTIIGFLIALAVVALTLFTSTLAKLRDFGVVKALGGTNPRLAKDVVAQAIWTIALAAATAFVLSLGLGAALAALTPNIRIVIEPVSVARTAAGALVIGLIAAAIPLRRVVRIDPASVFRSAQ
ncbi:MAG: ABC transporter permease [Actinobacteria bacterium]|nr:ABC transporter permease [Actinomycetota bacterium]